MADCSQLIILLTLVAYQDSHILLSNQSCVPPFDQQLVFLWHVLFMAKVVKTSLVKSRKIQNNPNNNHFLLPIMQLNSYLSTNVTLLVVPGKVESSEIVFVKLRK